MKNMVQKVVGNVGRKSNVTLRKTCFHLWSMWGGCQMQFCGKHGTKGCGQCGEVVNCSFVKTYFYLWSTWGGGRIQPCGKHGTICCGQCGEVVNFNIVENIFSLVVHVGKFAGCSFLENMVEKVVGNVGRW